MELTFHSHTYTNTPCHEQNLVICEEEIQRPIAHEHDCQHLLKELEPEHKLDSVQSAFGQVCLVDILLSTRHAEKEQYILVV